MAPRNGRVYTGIYRAESNQPTRLTKFGLFLVRVNAAYGSTRNYCCHQRGPVIAHLTVISVINQDPSHRGSCRPGEIWHWGTFMSPINHVSWHCTMWVTPQADEVEYSYRIMTVMNNIYIFKLCAH